MWHSLSTLLITQPIIYFFYLLHAIYLSENHVDKVWDLWGMDLLIIRCNTFLCLSVLQKVTFEQIYKKK